MHGRGLTQNIANITETDVCIKPNIHKYERIVYGFQQEKTLMAEIFMTMNAEILLKLYMNLRFEPINMHISINDLILRDVKNTRLESIMAFDVNIGLNAIKQMRFESINSFTATLRPSLNSYMKTEEINMSVQIGTLDFGKRMNKLKPFRMNELKNKKMNELRQDIKEVYGLKIGLIKRTRMRDLRGLRMNQLKNRRMQDIGRVVII